MSPGSLSPVTTRIVSTGKSATFTIERGGARLSPAEIKATRERLARLKFHPRDALPNATLLARADASHVELVGEARSVLAQGILRFRAALKTQDVARIAAERAALQALLLDVSRAR